MLSYLKLEKNAEEISKKRKELSLRSEIAEETRMKLELAEELSRVSKAFLEALSHQTREQLSNRVNNTFQKIFRKDYWAEIDEDYCLQIFKDIYGHGKIPVPEKSTGENQITSLCFIGSIVSLAKERSKTENRYFKGGVFPIVMDSPFGALDPDYREMIARYIPELADQIILLVSSSQWKGEVERECKPRVGKQVSLIYHSPKSEKIKESYYVRSGAEFEHTVIEEGYHG